MSTTLQVMLSATSKNPQGLEVRSKVTNAWIYWRPAGSTLLLRADGAGKIFAHAGAGPVDDPASYTAPFTASEGDTVDVAHSTEPKPLDETRISARLQSRIVEESLSASLASIGSIKAPVSGAKVQVKTLPLAEVRVPEFHKFVRAVCATTFGGRKTDVQAVNMDLFLQLNYQKGGGPAEFKGAHGSRTLDEIRRTLTASGPDPLDIVRDIGTAAKALTADDANERVVALVLHGNTDRIGRRDPGVFLLDADLQKIEDLKGEFDRRTRDVERARAALDEAKKSGDGDKISGAQDELTARTNFLHELDTDARLPTLQAFQAAAAALRDANVRTVELQACGTGDDSGAPSTFGLLSRLARLLSAKPNDVDVRGHRKAIWSLKLSGTSVQVWIGDVGQPKSGEQLSTETLPRP